MNIGEPSLSVPNAEGVPRLTDVALFLCGRAITSMWPSVVEADSHAAETFATWYLQRVAFMHERIPVTPNGPYGDDRVTEYRDCGEANFSLAFHALCRGPCEKDSSGLKHQKHQQLYDQRERSSSVPTVFGFAQQPASPRSTMVSTTVVEAAAGIDEKSRAFDFFEEVLELCRDVGGVDVRDKFLHRLVALITADARPNERTPQLYWGGRSEEERAAIVLPALSTLLGSLNDVFALHAAGSITRAFTVWMGVSWSCASFSWQMHVARAAGRWLVDLEARQTSATPGDTAGHTRPPQRPKPFCCRRPSSKGFYPARDGRQEPNIASMYDAMRRICEGCPLGDKGLLELLVQSGCDVQFPDQNVLEYMMGDQVTGEASQDTQQSHHSILLSITSGVLLYAQFYLSVRSLEAALHCAQTAVLVGHQWRSNEFLTMAHYSSFLVHIACQDTPAAAGDIAIMLQLADAVVRRENDTDAVANTPRLHAGCLGYMGAALLLLICPGTVDTYLRSVIISGVVAGMSASSDAAGGASCSGGTSNSKPMTAEAATGGNSVVVQTIAQTVRHALWLSEVEAFLDPSSTVATEMITGVARETMMIVAGHYGVRSSLKVINASTLGFLLAQLDEEASTKSLLIVQQPPILLLRETMRQTAHRALSMQVGTSDPSPGAGPFNILHDFLVAVETHYGEEGAEVVQGDFFFVSTYRFMCAMWLRIHGYMKSAYQELTRLAESMLFHSRCFGESSATGETCPSGVAASTPGVAMDKAEASTTGVERMKKTDGLRYWPPDHLLLWQHVQFERAQLAHYLGYSSTLPEISQSLRHVSAASHFVMGVLYADIISAIMWSQRRNFCGALQALDKVLGSAESIGLTLVQAHVRSQRVSILLACNRWRDALDTLQGMRPLPSVLERSFLLAQLHAQSELLMACPTATEEDLASVVEQHVRRMEACGCFLSESEQEDSVGIALTEKLCVHACIARLAVTTSAEQRRAWDADLSALSRELQHRQFQEGRWQLLSNTPMRYVCREILSGDLLQRIHQEA
ncbi:hypothetical protein DQ04_00691030 [Trypanosoma grayi]|uniref:hypothetical protein n=1 Tax=Trypanosoma grayi TaxID=71804 RepID=UPI0004F4387D|nr:hypothetical protein DQ04_00691030 [Trypanosoma grayi]KEG13957.1 hypothetical protein DQ04_00691030 [Trypanosoma grayi]